MLDMAVCHHFGHLDPQLVQIVSRDDGSAMSARRYPLYVVFLWWLVIRLLSKDRNAQEAANKIRPDRENFHPKYAQSASAYGGLPVLGSLPVATANAEIKCGCLRLGSPRVIYQWS